MKGISDACAEAGIAEGLSKVAGIGVFAADPDGAPLEVAPSVMSICEDKDRSMEEEGEEEKIGCAIGPEKEELFPKPSTDKLEDDV